jgi:hypothetical protein
MLLIGGGLSLLDAYQTFDIFSLSCRLEGLTPCFSNFTDIRGRSTARSAIFHSEEFLGLTRSDFSTGCGFLGEIGAAEGSSAALWHDR